MRPRIAVWGSSRFEPARSIVIGTASDATLGPTGEDVLVTKTIDISTQVAAQCGDQRVCRSDRPPTPGSTRVPPRRREGGLLRRRSC